MKTTLFWGGNGDEEVMEVMGTEVFMSLLIEG